LAFIARVMLPAHLPAEGPGIDEAVGNVQRFVRNASPEGLDEIRSRLRLLGTFAPLFSGAVPLLRKWLQENLPKLTGPQLDLIDQLKQVAVVPYYAHPRADGLVGYARPAFRPRQKTRLPTIEGPAPGKV